jgi:hypothetical protein
MDKTVEPTSRGELLAASEANMIAYWSSYGRGPGCTLHQAPGATWIYTGVQHTLFNCALFPQPGNVKAVADALRAKIEERGASALWWVGPQTEPDELGPLLEQNGLQPAGDGPAMAVDLAALDGGELLPGLKIERVTGADMQALWARTVCIGTGFPDEVTEALTSLEATLDGPEYLAQRRYIGFLDGTPVGTSALVTAGGVAGIYAVATLPAARRNGVGRTMTLLPLLEARHDGYRTGVLQASAMGYPVYTALGFREVCRYRFYLQS